MKKVIMTAALAMAAFASQAQTSDVQNATLSTSVPLMIALRPYNSNLPANNQNLSATVTNASAVLSSNNFDYTSSANPSYNGLAYRVYSNYSYRVSLKAAATGSNDELNGYVTWKAETLPSPQNGQAPWTWNNNGDHAITPIASSGNSRLSDVTASAQEILNNNGYSTGIFPAPAVLDPVNTDFAAFGIKFVAHPGFSITPGNYTTNLTITATTP